MQPDASNVIFQLAADLVNNTSQHIFLTGKAGTGKTTFLKYIKGNTRKNAVVVAPTGVAAINAGGVTMHSFFQLPFGPFIPETIKGFVHGDIADKNSLFKNLRLSADKREILVELDLLIIDEVSMVRCDMLDAVDTILRHFRKQWLLPFGGVQVLYIGDLYQLPPVIPAIEWEILHHYYESPFFFHSKVVCEAAPLYIELKKIYRQNEQQFIDVLNRVRTNVVTSDDLKLLNDRYKPAFSPPTGDKYITLSTHNQKANAINANELEKLPGQSFFFEGTIDKEFSEKAMPTDLILHLKEGAQVMFVKNDSSPDRKYFNGKLSTIKSINEEKIIVSFDNGNPDLVLKKETWRNIRYTYNKGTNSIEEEELGSFSQYPIRLAWAITIHKGQGLTFEKAIIDAGASFASGQVYVALSRCVSLNGLILYSKILPHCIAIDERVVAFAQKEMASSELQKILFKEQQRYWSDLLLKTFDWNKVVAILKEFAVQVPNKKLPDTPAAIELARILVSNAEKQSATASKFQEQLKQLLLHAQQSGSMATLEERTQKAILYFAKLIADELLYPLQQHISSLQYAAKVKKYIQELRNVESFLWQHLQKITRAKYGDIILCKEIDSLIQYRPKAIPQYPVSKKERMPIKGSSHRESLNLFKKGIPIEKIATMRNLALSTIHGHLAQFIKTGEMNIYELVSGERVKVILDAIEGDDGNSTRPIKERLGDDYSYSEIRAVLSYYHWQIEQTL